MMGPINAHSPYLGLLARDCPNLRDCTRDNALDVVYVPATFANPATCFMHGQAYLADSEMGRKSRARRSREGGVRARPTNRIDKAESNR
jgi:hypothetical protein